MRRLTTLTLVAVLTATNARTRAQEAADSGADAVQPIAIEGCLRSGSAAGEFIVSTGEERHTAMAEPGVPLADHVNHRVHLTGELEERSIGPVFVVSDVRTIAASCMPR